MKFKVGDKFKCISDDLFFFDVGEIYQMKEIDSNSCCLSALNNQYMYVSPSFLKKNFEKVEEDDLRYLLKVGYRLENEYQIIRIKDESHLQDLKNRFDSGLKETLVRTTIDKIYRPKYNGVKPMEWESVWERKEPKYYLRSWVDGCGEVLEDVFESEENYLNFETDFNFLFIADSEEIGFSKTQFTKEEIDNLPNQEFIKTLVKEEVK